MRQSSRQTTGTAFIACMCLLLAGGIAAAGGAETVNLFVPKAENLGWTFDNGREFPGAKGSLTAQTQDGKPTLVLKGDFTGGGNYVQMARTIDLAIDTLAFDLRADGVDKLTVRLVDAGKQCHQIDFAVKDSRDWQRVTFGLRRFFANKGKPGAVAGVRRYENWGGAKDGKWRGPAKLIVLLANRIGDLKKRQIAVRDFQAIVSAEAAAKKPAGKPTVVVRGWVPLIDAEGKSDWRLSLGQEFPGAKGELKVIADAAAPRKMIVRLTADFSGGGAYVEAQRRLRWMGVDDMDRLRFRVRSRTTGVMSLRVGDGTGQCHQAKSALRFEPDGRWHDVEVKLDDLIGRESWGGANDRKWHAPPQYITMIIGKPGGDAAKTPQVVEFADASVRSVVTVVQQAAAYAEGFETPAKLPAGWKGKGDTKVAETAPFEGRRALQLTRTLDDVGVATEAVGPAFAVVPGSWAIAAAVKSDLTSPDNSFKGVLRVQMLDASGKVIEQTAIDEPWGKGNWRAIRKQVTVPAGAARARFTAHLEKAHGSLWIDKLSASRLAAVQPQAGRVLRVLFDMAQLGHLLFPGDSADVKLTVEAGPPLPDDARKVTYVVTDYWGAEQIAPRSAALRFDSRGRDGRRIYKTVLAMDGAAFDVGKYYEVHVAIAEPGGQTHRDFTTLAYLPEAVTKKHTWREVPFSSRNWDNRIPAFIRLTDRLGIRLVGIWGGWRPEPPYGPRGPGVELARKLGMSILISTPSNAVERHKQGYEKWTHKPLYEGARAQVKKFGPEDRMAVTMGNEPPDVKGRADDAVAAYKALYEGYKSVNPKITLVGTSVGTVESYFKAGMGKYLDAYDFHTYNDVGGIRKTFARYDALFKKYGQRKPIWSTEIGLNSQGVERRAVAGDMIRKFTTFFACGGADVSWFGLLYPDPQGKISGSASDSHNVFNCKYNCYCPRLDAISYYNMVNAICIKKFVEERAYGDVSATLFRDARGRCLQVLWNNRRSVDAFVPLAGVGEVKHIFIDGSITMLDAGARGVTVRIGEDPILLLYEQKNGSLAEKLQEPRATIAAMPNGMVKGEAGDFVVRLAAGAKADDVRIAAPPNWSVRRKQSAGQALTFAIAPPRETSAREGLVRVPIARAGKTVGLLALRRRVRGAMTARLAPLPMKDGKAGVRLVVINNSADAQQVRWKASLGKAFVMVKGKLNMDKPTEADAYFGDAAEGRLTILGHSTARADLPLLGVNPLATYTVRARVTDPQGRVIRLERLMGGFASAARADSPIKPDGKLDEAAWRKAQVVAIDKADQYFPLSGLNPTPWGGPADCSAKVRMLWDDKNLYLGLEITDDILHQHERGGKMWQQDGVQLLIDPGRGVGEPLGKYDYSMGVGAEGPQVWCHLSANPTVPNGDVKDITYAQVETGKGGNRTVEIAIPWRRLAPFKPAVGASLGMSIVINEDDKPMRNCYMNWFGDIMNKSTKANGDVILTE